MERIESRRNESIQKELMELRRQRSEAALLAAKDVPVSIEERFTVRRLHTLKIE